MLKQFIAYFDEETKLANFHLLTVYRQTKELEPKLKANANGNVETKKNDRDGRKTAIDKRRFQ